MENERRSEPRVKRRLFVSLRIVAERRTFFAYTGDISRSGMFIETRELRPVGARINLQGGSGEVEMVVARVRESAPAGMALRLA